MAHTLVRITSTAVGTVLAGAVLLSVTGCQPESPVDKLKGKGNVSEQVEGETTWGGGDGPEYTPQPTLPSSFPVADIPLADGTITDAGERSPGVWFANVRVPDVAAVESALNKLKAAGFAIKSDEEAGSDRAVTLQNERYDINFLTISETDGVTISYDVTSRG